MLETLNAWDQSVFLFLNGIHASWADPIFWAISGTVTWIPFYAFLLFVIIRKYSNAFRDFQWQSVALLVVSIALTITLADQTASGFMKPFFERLRPSHAPELEGLVHLLKKGNGDIYKGGKFGFVSSHAANSFALMLFVIRVVRHNMLSIFMVVWAIVVSYSRIYLGVHYPGDLLGGALVGMLAGYVGSALYLNFIPKWSKA